MKTTETTRTDYYYYYYYYYYCRLCEENVIPNIQITDRPILRCPRCNFKIGEWSEDPRPIVGAEDRP